MFKCLRREQNFQESFFFKILDENVWGVCVGRRFTASTVVRMNATTCMSRLQWLRLWKMESKLVEYDTWLNCQSSDLEKGWVNGWDESQQGKGMVRNGASILHIKTGSLTLDLHV